MRFDEGEPAEIIADFRPDWSAPGYGSSVPIWRLARAGDGFVALAELAGEHAGKRGLVLLDEAGATVQEVVVEGLPPAAGVTVTGALEYAIGTTDDCIDVEWMETDGLDVTEDGYPMRLWLQSFCCVD